MLQVLLTCASLVTATIPSARLVAAHGFNAAAAGVNAQAYVVQPIPQFVIEHLLAGTPLEESPGA